MRVLNFGSMNIDTVFSVSHAVLAGESLAVSNPEIHAGGKGLNQSIAAARAGAKVFHAGCVGNDGEFLLRFLEENGVVLTDALTKRKLNLFLPFLTVAIF